MKVMTMASAIAALACLMIAASPLAAAAEVSVIEGVKAPEDLEALPGGRFVIASAYQRTDGVALVLFDRDKETWAPLPVMSQARKGWGDAACAAPSAPVSSHGLSLSKRAGGAQQLLVVNHGGRESVEFYEIRNAAASPRAIWRGCVITGEPLNDVAPTGDGGFIATVMVANGKQMILPPDGSDTGFVMRWAPGSVVARLPGSDGSYPNGIVASRDGKTAYVAHFGAHLLRKIDAGTGRELARVELPLAPDNATWRADGKIIVAGAASTQAMFAADCEKINGSCAAPFAAVAVDPDTLAISPVYAGEKGVNYGTSVALQLGRVLYFGSFNATRLLKVELDK